MKDWMPPGKMHSPMDIRALCFPGNRQVLVWKKHLYGRSAVLLNTISLPVLGLLHGIIIASRRTRNGCWKKAGLSCRRQPISGPHVLKETDPDNTILIM